MCWVIYALEVAWIVLKQKVTYGLVGRLFVVGIVTFKLEGNLSDRDV